MRCKGGCGVNAVSARWQRGVNQGPGGRLYEVIDDPKSDKIYLR
jgi:hypothetical protein